MKIVKPSKVGLAKKRLRRITKKMQQYIDRGELAGTLTLVARQGKVAHFEMQGLRDIEAKQPMTEDTLFRIYSMTKPITSLAVLMLYEEGHFQLMDPVATIIPAFNKEKVFVKPTLSGWQLIDPERPITIRDLLTHTAGLSYGIFGESPIDQRYLEGNLLRHDLPLDQMVEKLAEIPLLYQPGTSWQYSIATDVLSRVVEVVSGQSFDQFLTQRIFKPLGMTETGFYVPQDKMDRFAALYEPAKGGGIKLMDPGVSERFMSPPAGLLGGGGLVSTMGDYLRFCQMMLNCGVLDGARLVSRKTIELMTANHIEPALMPIGPSEAPMRGYGFGLGVRVLVDPAQSQMLGSVGEYGWGGLATTYFFIDPLEEMIGILMTQLIPPETHPVRIDFRVLAYQAIVD